MLLTALACLFVSDLTSCENLDPPPPLPISDNEFPRPTVNPVPYPGKGVWKQPPSHIDVGFVPQQTYTQVRRTSTVEHLPQSDALESASDIEEVVNAPRLREVVKHTQLREVYEEEGFEDNAYDHGGYKKAAENNEGYAKHGGGKDKRSKPRGDDVRGDNQGQHSEIRERQHGKKEDASDKYEGKGDGAIDDDKTEPMNDRNQKYGNRNYRFGRVKHQMEIKSGFDKVDDKGKRTEGKLGSRRNKYDLNSIKETMRNQARKRQNKREDKKINIDNSEQETSPSEKYEEEGTLEDSFGKDLSSTDRPDKAKYLEAVDEERRLKEEDRVRDAEIEQHFLETSGDLAKDFIPTFKGIDHRKFPFYKTTRNKMSPLRYALSPSEIPVKTEGGMEFYDSKNVYHCDEVKGPGKVTPTRQKDGEWAGAPRQGIFPRLKGLGDKIDCFKTKYWGKEPLDNPFFREDSTESVENKKRDTHDNVEEASDEFAGFYADILGNIKDVENGHFPALNFESKKQFQPPRFQKFEPSDAQSAYSHVDNTREDNEDEDEDETNEDRDERNARRPETLASLPKENVKRAPKTVDTSNQPRALRSKQRPRQAYYPRFKAGSNHHHIILNIFPPRRPQKAKKENDEQSPRVNENPEPGNSQSNSYPLYPPLVNEYRRPIYPSYQNRRPPLPLEQQSSYSKLIPYPIKHTRQVDHEQKEQHLDTSRIKPSTSVVNNEDYMNIFGMLPPPANKHFKYQTLTLLKQNVNDTHQSKPVENAVAETSKSETKFPIVDNMALETYRVVASVSNLTETQLRHPHVRRKRRTRTYKEEEPVEEEYQEDVAPKRKRKRKRPRKKNRWRNEQTTTEEYVEPPPREVEDEEKPERLSERYDVTEDVDDDAPTESPPARGYDVHEEVEDDGDYDFRRSEHRRPVEDEDYPPRREEEEDEGDEEEDRPRVRNTKQFYVQEEQTDEIEPEEVRTPPPEAPEGRRRKLKKKRKRPGQKKAWRNVESYEVTERDVDNDKYEWGHHEKVTIEPPVQEPIEEEVPYTQKPEVVYEEEPKRRRKKYRKKSQKRLNNPNPIPEYGEFRSRFEEYNIPEDVYTTTENPSQRYEHKFPVIDYNDYNRNYGYHPHGNNVNGSVSPEQTISDRIKSWLKEHDDLEILTLKSQDKAEIKSEEPSNSTAEVTSEETTVGATVAPTELTTELTTRRSSGRKVKATTVESVNVAEITTKKSTEHTTERRPRGRGEFTSEKTPDRETEEVTERVGRRGKERKAEKSVFKASGGETEGSGEAGEESERLVESLNRRTTERSVEKEEIKLSGGENEEEVKVEYKELESLVSRPEETQREIENTGLKELKEKITVRFDDETISKSNESENKEPIEEKIEESKTEDKEQIEDKIERKDTNIDETKVMKDRKDDETSDSEEIDITPNYPRVSKNNHIVTESTRRSKSLKKETEKEESSEKPEPKNAREKAELDEAATTDGRRGEPRYKKTEVEDSDGESNNTHTTISEEVRLTPGNAPAAIKLTTEEINAKLAQIFKGQKFGSRYSAKSPQSNVNTQRKLHPDDTEKISKNSEPKDGVAVVNVEKVETTSSRPRTRPVFSIKSRGQVTNGTNSETKSEVKPETLRSRTQFNQRAGVRSRDVITTTTELPDLRYRGRSENNQRTKNHNSYEITVTEINRVRSRRPNSRSSTTTEAPQSSNLAKPRSRNRFGTNLRDTQDVKEEDTVSRATSEVRKLIRKGRDKSTTTTTTTTTTEAPKEVKKKENETNDLSDESKDVSEEANTTTAVSTSKAPRRVFLFNRAKPSTTAKPEVTTKRVGFERPKKPVDILTKLEPTLIPPVNVRYKIPAKHRGDVIKQEKKSQPPTKTNLRTNSIRKSKPEEVIESGTKETTSKTKPRLLKNFETRRVTKEEIFTTSYIPDEDDDEDGEETDEEEIDEDDDDNDEYADESEQKNTYKPYEESDFHNERFKGKSRRENVEHGGSLGQDQSPRGSRSNTQRRGRGFVQAKDSLKRQALATDRTLTYIVDPGTRIGRWVEGRSR